MSRTFCLTLVLIAGCVSSKSVPLPDGSDGVMVRCTSTDRCLIEAAEVCGKYRVLHTKETGSAVPGVDREYKWLIQCLD